MVRFHHRSLVPGYVKKEFKDSGIKEPYFGKFGIGYTISRYNPDSTRYKIVDYYIDDDPENTLAEAYFI